ncbi:MAG TPA: hypothetical protein VNO32_64570, partial [Candidatus Acidoferrum sp.]|nr:hypothetical protein [Candidatus Acidoferrum sp.]
MSPISKRQDLDMPSEYPNDGKPRNERPQGISASAELSDYQLALFLLNYKHAVPDENDEESAVFPGFHAATDTATEAAIDTAIETTTETTTETETEAITETA